MGVPAPSDAGTPIFIPSLFGVCFFNHALGYGHYLFMVIGMAGIGIHARPAASIVIMSRLSRGKWLESDKWNSCDTGYTHLRRLVIQVIRHTIQSLLAQIILV